MVWEPVCKMKHSFIPRGWKRDFAQIQHISKRMENILIERYLAIGNKNSLVVLVKYSFSSIIVIIFL